jgi:hypothetical protein
MPNMISSQCFGRVHLKQEFRQATFEIKKKSVSPIKIALNLRDLLPLLPKAIARL